MIYLFTRLYFFVHELIYYYDGTQKVTECCVLFTRNVFSPSLITTLLTRMHSSRMRTVLSSSRLLGGGGGVGVSQHALRQTPTPPTPVDRMTDRCKNNLSATSFADGKYALFIIIIITETECVITILLHYSHHHHWYSAKL